MTPDSTAGPTDFDPHQVAAAISELCADSRLIGTVRAVTLTHSIRCGVDVGDLADLVEDTMARLQVELWLRREAFAAKTTEDQRRWTFGIAKNFARQAVDKQLRENKRIARITENQPDTTAAPIEPHHRAAKHLSSRIRGISGVGAQGWEKIARRAAASSRTRRALLAALEAIHHGTEPDLAAIVAPVIDTEAWPAERTRRGRNLSTQAAVRDGAYATHQDAGRALARWWLDNTAGPLCPARMVDAGLFDHIPPGKRRAAASQALRGVAEGQVANSSADNDGSVAEIPPETPEDEAVEP